MARERRKRPPRCDPVRQPRLRYATEKTRAAIDAFKLLSLLVVAAVPLVAGAVPIPWKNCGAPGDDLQITQAAASSWPPPAAAPAHAMATFDAAGNLLDLQIVLLHGVLWTFDSGPLSTITSAGFVSLPGSFPVSVESPALPLAAGPYSTTQTFTDNGASVTIADKANVLAPVNSGAFTKVSLSSNGAPGFPLVSAPGDAYEIRVQMTESGGAEIFCMDLVEPFKTANPFVSIHEVAVTPTLSTGGVITLVVMLLATGLFARRRSSLTRRRR